MPAPNPNKTKLYDTFAEVTKAFGSGRKLEILDLLDQAPRSVEDIAHEIGRSVANTSYHLRPMAQAGVLTSHREGNRIFYRVSSEQVAEAWSAIRRVAIEHHPGIDRSVSDLFGDRSSIAMINAQELLELLCHDDVLVIDVRPALEYRNGHIAGAVSTPLGQLPDLLTSMPCDGMVVAYCRGPYCTFADQAIRMLRQHSVDGRRLRESFPEWRRAGYPIEIGEEARLTDGS